MVRANLKMTVRNRQAIFWNLAFPAIFILLFGAIFGGGGTNAFSVGIAGGESPLRDQVTRVIVGSDAFTVHEADQASELDALRDDDRDVVLVFPDGAPTTANPVRLYYSDAGGPNGQIARGAVRSVLMDIIGANAGVAVTDSPISTADLSFIDFFVPGILAMSLMNSGIIGLSTTFVSFREQGILRRIKVTPFALWKFILARIVSSLVVMLATSAILVGVGKVVWGLTVRGNLLLTLGVLIVGGLAFLAIGYAIAAFSRNTESAASYANLITFPMLFLSGVFFPVDSMPSWIRPVVQFLPLRYLVDALREPMMYGNGIGAVWRDLLVLTAVFAVCMVIAIRFFKWDATPR
jgi:ABC-2 type transport system permease protein